MPIQFRCNHCKQMLSVSSRKMGATVNCPSCTEPILVPISANGVPATAEWEAKPATLRNPNQPGSSAPASTTRPAVLPSTSPGARPAAPPNAPKSSSPVKPALAKNLWADEVADNDTPRGIRDSRLTNDGLDMTPMVDVTFQLLIFFMITASFVTQKSLQTTPPEPNEDTGTVSVQLDEMQDQSVIVSIDAEGKIHVDDFPVEGSAALVEMLMAKIAVEQKSELLIEADYNAKHGAIIQVIDAGISAGMQNIRKTSRQDE